MGEGLRGSDAAHSTLQWISIFHSTTHNQTGPLWCWFLSGWACAPPRPLWVSPTTSPVRLGVSPAAAPTPTGSFNQRSEVLFPCTGALGYAVCFAPCGLSRFICANVGPQGLLMARLPAPCPTLRQSWSRHGHASPLRPSCPSPHLLPVWLNVYFLFPCCRTSLPFDFLSVLVV